MDLGIPIEDKFARLHPCLPVNTKIGIIGGGPSGVSAAYALAMLGYDNVTLLEKHHTVGGMCESVEIEGRVYDLGGQVLAANSAPFIFHLAKETDSELDDMASHKLALIESSTGKYEDIKVAEDYVSVMSLTLELQDKAKDSGRVGVHAVSQYASDLAPTYLKDHGIASIPKSVAYGYTASGYGFVQDMPYAYIHEFTRTSMAGKIRRFKEGYTSLWQKLVQALPINTHCNTEVTAVRRTSSGVKVHTKNNEGQVEHFEFDKVIISGSFPISSGKAYRSPDSDIATVPTGIMDMSNLEEELFSKVVTIDYYTTAMKIKGLEDMPKGFYYFGEFMDDPATIGYPVAMQKFYDDTDIFLFWSYGNSSDIMGPKVTELVIDIVKKIGGKVETVVLQRRFKYFPHVSSQDMKDGFYEKLESEVQGSMNTYYVGGLMAFELTERNSSYAMSLVCKHFASHDSTPKFPYAKRLFPMKPKSSMRKPRELGERPGVEYPNLKSLDGYLKHWGTHEVTKDTILYSWLNEEGAVISRRSYRELNANAECIAHKLLTSQKPVIKPGDRVLLVHLPGLDFVDAFFGCLRAKVLPVPVLPPDPLQRGGQALLKIANIVESSKAVAILSTAGYQLAVRAGNVKNLISLSGKNENAKWPSLPWLNTDSWVKSSKNMKLGSNFDQPESCPEDLCFLQFTSGSTGDAKGVMITHGGLIHNVKLMRERYRSTSNTVLVSWLPQYHDMGLIGGLFTALVSGGSAVLFSPLTFIKNPLLWLDVMSNHKATHSAGPNFAFELVVRRLEADKEKIKNFDLSSLIFLMIAAEPVRQKTLKRFIELTQPCGLSQDVMAPGYGLAENCVFVSCAFGNAEPITVDWQGRVCCGYAEHNNADVDIRIVDPETSVEQKEAGKEGEIWISSPSAGVGYWGREDLSKKTFQNELQDMPGRRYTTTGDLGRIIDGKLFITGRIKDLIIVAGRNIYSADIEKTVENSCEFLRPGCCAVIGVPEEVLSSKGIMVPDTSDQFGLVVIAEVRDGKPVGENVIEHIQTRVAEEHGVSVASVKLIKPRTISKTTSGKIKRFECLEQFTKGKLQLAMEPVVTKKSLIRSYTTGTCKEGSTPRARFVKTPHLAPSPTGRLQNSDIVEFLKSLVSEQTMIPIQNVSATESLVSYGIDSIGVVRASQKLSDFLGVPVGAVDIFTATCIADLANFSESLVLKSQHQTQNDSSLLQETGPDNAELLTEISTLRQLSVFSLQLPAVIYVAGMLLLPAYLSVTAFTNMVSIIHVHSYTEENLWMDYLVPLTLAPLCWILCIFSTCISIAFLGNSFLKPNYTLTPEISIWSLDFVRWWALYKAQDTASKVLAIHLRGTVFLKYWYEMLGAKVGSSVLLDTVDITDPSLVLIGDGTVIAEGALLQSHEVNNGVLSFLPIKIGRNSIVGPYAVIQKGSTLSEESEVAALQKVEAGKSASIKSKAYSARKDASPTKDDEVDAIYHIMGIYLVGLLGSLAAAVVYFLYIWMSQVPPSLQHFTFVCLSGAFHWVPFLVVVYSMIFSAVSLPPVQFAALMAAAFLAHGLTLSLLTCIATHFLADKPDIKNSQLKTWMRHRIIVYCHQRFAKLLSGTEAFCWYLRLLGAKVGKHCSIRAINPILDPEHVSIGSGVHLGDFSRIISGFYTSKGYTRAKVEVQNNSVVGSQSIVLPGSLVQENVILGALSVAPMHSVLQRGGIYIGSQAPVMIKNTMHALDERIEDMDLKYKKIVGNLAANLAVTTLKVNSRYFHRIGVSGKGVLKIYDEIKGFPEHKIFSPGKSYQIIVRHSNSLSADDDARIDARGAALRILAADRDDENNSSPLLDLTLKTGNAFYARTVADFATWLVCGLKAREEHVKRAPHVREAVWASLRQAESYAELHYYSNICRLFRFTDGTEMYVKLKLRPYDESITEDSGKVEPTGILPPETGAIPRDENDVRPLLFLADDFRQRVNSSDGVRYILQLQFRPVPDDKAVQDTVLDCTKPWDEKEFPHLDVGEICIDQNLTSIESEELQFNPFLRSPEIDVIRATSCTESASIDHGRSLIYEICQHLRNGEPLPEAWRIFLNQSDVQLDLSGCPMATAMKPSHVQELTLARTWYQNLWALFAQPVLQTFLPYFLLGLVLYVPLNWALRLKVASSLPLYALLPPLWVTTGALSGLACSAAKWVLVGKNKEGESVLMWSSAVFMDTIWQAFRSLVGDYFMDMTSGSVFFLLWMKLMGSDIDISHGTYVDSTGAVLNPEMVEIGAGGCVGREALLFGHIYEGDGGKVKFGKIKVGEGGFVGSRAVAMPGVRIDKWGSLSASTLAMKEEVIMSR
uniref:Carrier domain-containing protein n=1 Tax=Kalanchoe fedtschenkoi TaxID=63787 RepID=A0A7N0TLS4_KALFE